MNRRARWQEATLRAPFHGQCFIAAVFALLLGLSATLLTMGNAALVVPGATLATTAVLWYVGVQARWSHVCCGAPFASALGLAAYGFLKASVIVVSAALALSLVS